MLSAIDTMFPTILQNVSPRMVVLVLMILVLVPGNLVEGRPARDIPREGHGEQQEEGEKAPIGEYTERAKSDTGKLFRTNSLKKLDPLEQLKKYGYLQQDASNLPSGKQDPQDTIKAIQLFQNFYGLNETGQLDEETLELMNTPRCSNVDIQQNRSRVKRFDAIARWSRNSLTWRLTNAPSAGKHTHGQVESIVRNALRLWSDASNLNFRNTRSIPDIDISFHRREHGDGDPFDGPGGILAHAYFPYAGGDMHLDDEENWTSSSTRGVNLFQIIAHEAGHALGLGHSKDRNALMYAYYRGYQPNFKLGQDDVNGVQRLYGYNVNPIPQTPSPTWYPTPQPTYYPPTPQPTYYPTPRPTYYPTPRPTYYPTARPTPVPPRPTFVPPPPATHFCQSGGRFDAIVSFQRHSKTYAFEGNKYYSLNDKGVDAGYPRYIDADFSRELTHVDTAIILKENGLEYLYIIQNGRVWKFTYDPIWGAPSKVWSTPVRLQDVFDGLPSDIDAGFYFEKYAAIYFFRGPVYYRLHRRSTGGHYTYSVDRGYPLDRSIWSLPSQSVACVFTWEGNQKIYFFAGSQYYRYDENRLQIDIATTIPYPRVVKEWWLGCPRSSGLRSEEDALKNNQTDIDPYQYAHEKKGVPVGTNNTQQGDIESKLDEPVVDDGAPLEGSQNGQGIVAASVASMVFSSVLALSHLLS